jgi:hypothetical protein
MTPLYPECTYTVKRPVVRPVAVDSWYRCFPERTPHEQVGASRYDALTIKAKGAANGGERL